MNDPLLPHGDDVVRSPTAKLGRRRAAQPIESFQYRPTDSAIYDASEAQKGACADRCRTLNRWVFILVIAVLVGLAAVFVTFCTRQLFAWRFQLLDMMISMEQTHNLIFGPAMLVFMAVPLGYALAAALPTAWLEPVAAGSGICEIKVILNGAILPRVLR